MTQQEKRIKIAEACGWKDCHFPLASNVHEPITERVVCGIPPQKQTHSPLPDYFNDLNAIHEAEIIIPDDRWPAYCNRLNGIYFGITRGMSSLGAYAATATQRAEAFGLTLSLWTHE